MENKTFKTIETSFPIQWNTSAKKASICSGCLNLHEKDRTILSLMQVYVMHL